MRKIFILGGVIPVLAGGVWIFGTGARMVEVKMDVDEVLVIERVDKEEREDNKEDGKLLNGEVKEGEGWENERGDLSGEVKVEIEKAVKKRERPEEVRALYVTNWVAGTDYLFEDVLKKIEGSRVNALVIDIKDYSGFVGYDTHNEQAIAYGAKIARIRDLNRLLLELEKREIYTIARLTVFQDPRLALARPELALKTPAGDIWKDHIGLAWMDPASREVWDYNIGIAREAAERGFDEINFDYIRFPSDGLILEAVYPVWNKEIEKREVIREFFEYLREETEGIFISADIFGQTLVASGDQGIGQRLEDAYEFFDVIAPMIYPSHFAIGFAGFKNPAEFPYEVVFASLTAGIERLVEYEREKKEEEIKSGDDDNETDDENEAREAVSKKIRPWLQDFNLGAVYTPEMVKRQMEAVLDVGLGDAWMLWNPSVNYREAVIK